MKLIFLKILISKQRLSVNRVDLKNFDSASFIKWSIANSSKSTFHQFRIEIWVNKTSKTISWVINIVTYFQKATPTLLFRQNPHSSSAKKWNGWRYLTNAFSVKNKHTYKAAKQKETNYSINTFTSCIEDDNSTFQREELIFVHLIIHHAGPLWMYTLYTQRRIWLQAAERDWELEKETQRHGPISQSCVCHDFTNTSAITLN